MSMRKSISIFAATALLTTVASTTLAGQPPKIGTQCLRANQTLSIGGYKYVCQKSGKKYVWSKGVKVAQRPNSSSSKPMPSASPSSTVTPIDSSKPVELQNCPLNSPWAIGYTIDLKKLIYLSCGPDGHWHPQDNAPTINQITGQPNSTPSPTPSKIALTYPEGSGNPNPPSYPETDASRYIQNLINNVDLNKSTNTSTINLIAEPGNNGPYVDIAKNGVAAALKFYSALGLNIPKNVINVVLGRTQDWSYKTVDGLYHCVDSNFQFTGGYAICPSPTSPAVIYTNLVSGTIHTPNPDPNTDLTHVIETSDWAADFAHETFHVFQNAYPTNLPDSFPLWVGEGSAQLFGYMTGALMSKGAITYNQEVEKYLDWQHNVQSTCNGPIDQMQPPCNYTQGLFVTEFFISKFGIGGFDKLLHGSYGATYSQQFLNATGESVSQFNQEADQALRARGWEK